jgi:DNA polymerase-4
VTDSKMCRGSATLIAESIRNDIHTELGLTASAGVAPIKFLANSIFTLCFRNDSWCYLYDLVELNSNYIRQNTNSIN